MKKIILLLFFTSFAFAQTTNVQVKFNAGYYVYDTPVNGNFSNDATFNQILTNNAINTCYPIGSGPIFSDETNAAVINCPNGNLSSLLNALNNYTVVVQKTAIETQNFTMADVLTLSLVNPSIGTYTTTIGDIVQTNDSNLNAIFQTYNVNKYENSSLVRCNCNVGNLKSALNGLPSVINTTNYVGYVILLGTPEFGYKNAKIYPNPFSTTLTIETKETISHYLLFDINGKQLIKTALKNELDTQTAKTSPGIYLLQIEFENGTTIQQKIIKK